MEQKIITEFIRSKMADGLAQATIDSYCYAMKDFWQYCVRNRIEHVDSHDIENYFIFLHGKKYSQATLRDKYAVLHAFFNYAVKAGYYSKLPINVKKPKVSNIARCFTEEEICKILQYFSVRNSFIEIRNYTIICILLGTGIRRNELLSITDIDKNSIIITGKGSKQRIVPISAMLKHVIAKYIVERNRIAVCRNLIVTRDGMPLTKDGLRAVFAKISRETGIGGKRFSSHTFRHTYATISLQNGMDIGTLSGILGHSNISTTAIYLHYNNDNARKQNNECNPLNNFRIFF